MRWGVEWIVDRSEEPASIPAYRFLKSLPVNVRVQLLAILEAVKTTGPDQWADRHSHSPMKGGLADLHEVRDKQGETLYRLFVLWQRKERRVVIIDGRAKANRTKLSEAEYEAVQSLAAKLADDPPPFASVDDFIQADLKA
ncbi:MAG TPA: type II toxin-antitoxin system RelE/ParE family toxin [Solirubrobacterales bacterium]|nr:type II toxin-antitoxin system RelE/ParE family toxin [Solirubrobacterales bacterium]